MSDTGDVQKASVERGENPIVSRINIQCLKCWGDDFMPNVAKSENFFQGEVFESEDLCIYCGHNEFKVVEIIP